MTLGFSAMSKHVRTIQFQVGLSGAVDRSSGVIRGVSLITSGIEAVGHDLHVDETTLTQMLSAAQRKGQIPVKLNHGSGVENVCGYVNNFRIEGKQLRGDWHLLKSHAEYAATLEKAEVMPTCFGLSAAFAGKDEKKGGKTFARCQELMAVDCVAQPAANPTGLFAAKATELVRGTGVGIGDRLRISDFGLRIGCRGAVASSGRGAVDTLLSDMADEIDPNADPLAQVLAGISNLTKTVEALTGRIDSIEQNQGALNDLINEPDLAQLANLTDEELDAAGYDVDAVRAAVEQAVARGELVSDGTSDQGPGTRAATAAGAGVGDGAATNGAQAAVAALSRKVDSFIKNFAAKEAAAEAAAEEQELQHAFGVLETKVDALTKELAAKNAELQAVRANRRTGAEPVGAGVHLFDANPGDEERTDFEKAVSARFTELMKQTGMTEVKARAQAVQFCIRSHPVAYKEFRESGRNIVTLGK